MPKKRYNIQAICRNRAGRILSSAFNSYHKTHPVQAHFARLAGHPHKKYLHAEISAVLKAGAKRVHSIEIINHSSDLLPYPCAVCQKMLQAYGINEVSVKSRDYSSVG
jgi:deoxycytidylate deaminase